MSNVIPFEELRFRKEILDIYDSYESSYSEKEREDLKRNILNPTINHVIEQLKENGLPVDFDKLRGNVTFFDMLFDNLCDQIISVNPLTRNTTQAFKADVKAYLYDRRETDKDSLLFDEDGYDSRPEISEYEFHPFRMIDHVESYVDRVIDEKNNGTKK